MTGGESTAGRDGSGVSRRDVLAAAGASGVIGLAGCLPTDSGDGATPTPTEAQGGFTNMPVDDEVLRVGVSVPQTGVYKNEGDQLLAGYDLAAKNINESDSEQSRGYVNNEHFEVLAGESGVLGREIELVTSNTRSIQSQARRSAETLIDNQDVNVLVGGASSDEAIVHQEVARDREIVHMIGFAPGNSISGSDCALTGFQEMFNAKMAAEALSPVLVREFGTDATYAQVSPNSDVGANFETSMREKLTGVGWQELTAERTRVGTENFEPEIQTATEQGPDVLVLNFYGLDGAFALSQAANITEGTEIDVVVPLYNRPMAQNAGGAMDGVLGTIHWEEGILKDYSRRFKIAWSDEHAQSDRRATTPSGLAHLAYSQLFQYAAAAERAGTFEPPAVVSELEGFTYDIGLGDETMRACDHTAARPVPVVRGLSEDQRYFGKYYEVEEIITDVTYRCDQSPAANCDVGSF